MMSVPPIHSPELSGAGIGIRSAHYSEVLETLPQVPWFEALTDNYLNPGGRPLAMLDQIRKHYPVTLHGVGMSLGGTAPLCEDYLQALKSLIARIAPTFISDHLCWNQHQGRFGNDLFPLPYTREAIKHIVPRIQYVQEYLGRSILIENVSSYLSYQCSEMTEAEFLTEVVNTAGCGLLCDVNNIYVSARNHGFDACDYIDQLPQHAIREMHLAGFEDRGDFLLDTHGAAVHEEVWQLYDYALERFGPVPTLIEWDTDIPAFDILLQERERAAKRMRRYDDRAA